MRHFDVCVSLHLWSPLSRCTDFLSLFVHSACRLSSTPTHNIFSVFMLPKPNSFQPEKSAYTTPRRTQTHNRQMSWVLITFHFVCNFVVFFVFPFLSLDANMHRTKLYCIYLLCRIISICTTHISQNTLMLMTNADYV